MTFRSVDEFKKRRVLIISETVTQAIASTGRW